MKWSIWSGLYEVVFMKWSIWSGLYEVVYMKWSIWSGLYEVVYMKWSIWSGLYEVVYMKWSIWSAYMKWSTTPPPSLGPHTTTTTPKPWPMIRIESCSCWFLPLLGSLKSNASQGVIWRLFIFLLRPFKFMRWTSVPYLAKTETHDPETLKMALLLVSCWQFLYFWIRLMVYLWFWLLDVTKCGLQTAMGLVGLTDNGCFSFLLPADLVLPIGSANSLYQGSIYINSTIIYINTTIS